MDRVWRRSAQLATGCALLVACRAEPAATGGPLQGIVLLPVPADSEIPAGALGVSIRRGRALLGATGDSLPAHVGNALTCTSCHPDEGRRANAMPWVGVYARFPQYRSRSGSVQVIEDRINDCFLRSMNGVPLPWDSREMRDIIAYFAFVSRGVAPPGEVRGQGLPMMSPLVPDTARGAAIFVSHCARCHGARGEGSTLGTPVWGPRSYNIGAGMARLRTAASFVRHNMPQDRPGTLSDQDAFDVAAYVNSRPRPDLPGKERDWPNGDPPPDVAYETLAARAKRSNAAPTTPSRGTP